MEHEWTDSEGVTLVATVGHDHPGLDERGRVVVDGFVGEEILRLAERVRELEGSQRWYIDQHENDGTRIAALEAENAALREQLDRSEHDFTYMQRRLDGEDEPEQEFPVPGCNCTNCRDAR